MADLNIQRKKNVPSAWWLVLLAAVLLAAAAYFYLRPDPADEPLPADPTGLVAPESPDAQARATPPPAAAAPGIAEAEAGALAEQTPATPEALAALAAADPAAPGYARRTLRTLTATLVDLADRADFRTPAIMEQRDNLTSATSRLDAPAAPLRAGFVAAASLLRTMQQQGYPTLEADAQTLLRQANELSGRTETAAEQQQTQRFLTDAAAMLKRLSLPPAGQ